MHYCVHKHTEKDSMQQHTGKRERREKREERWGEGGGKGADRLTELSYGRNTVCCCISDVAASEGRTGGWKV